MDGASTSQKQIQDPWLPSSDSCGRGNEQTGEQSMRPIPPTPLFYPLLSPRGVVVISEFTVGLAGSIVEPYPTPPPPPRPPSPQEGRRGRTKDRIKQKSIYLNIRRSVMLVSDETHSVCKIRYPSVVDVMSGMDPGSGRKPATSNHQ